MRRRVRDWGRVGGRCAGAVGAVALHPGRAPRMQRKLLQKPPRPVRPDRAARRGPGGSLAAARPALGSQGRRPLGMHSATADSRSDSGRLSASQTIAMLAQTVVAPAPRRQLATPAPSPSASKVGARRAARAPSRRPREGVGSRA